MVVILSPHSALAQSEGERALARTLLNMHAQDVHRNKGQAAAHSRSYKVGFTSSPKSNPPPYGRHPGSNFEWTHVAADKSSSAIPDALASPWAVGANVFDLDQSPGLAHG